MYSSCALSSAASSLAFFQAHAWTVIVEELNSPTLQRRLYPEQGPGVGLNCTLEGFHPSYSAYRNLCRFRELGLIPAKERSGGA